MRQRLPLLLAAALVPSLALADDNGQGRSSDHVPAPARQERGIAGTLAQQNYWQQSSTWPMPVWEQSPWNNPWNSPLQQPPNYNYNITIPNPPTQTWHPEPPYGEQAAKQAAFDALVKKVAAEARAQRGLAPGAAMGPFSSAVDSPGFRLKPRPKDFALVIGIENYPRPLPPALFARRDAEAVKANLLALGWPSENVISLLGEQATKARIEAYLEDWLPKNAARRGRVFFYFSGHGSPSVAGNAYIVPWDGSPNFLESTAIPLQRLYADLAKIKASEVTAALDSCFSGAGGRSVLPQGARPLIVAVSTPLLPKGPAVVFTATGARGISGSLPQEGHGIFTYYFLKGLESAVSRKMGAIQASWLYGYLDPKVKKAAALQNLDESPRLEGDGSKTVVKLR